MDISFLGASQTVTGSKFLVQTGRTKILVDCGLFQGLKDLRLKNWKPLPFAPSEIDGIFLTHAHIDHSGYIPLMVRDGFRGRIYCTEPTQALCRILLPDAGHLAEEDAAYANRMGFSKHKPALPLYTAKDALDCLDRFEALEPYQAFPFNDLTITLEKAGHILGAASVHIRYKNRTVLFSGDIGRYNYGIDPSPPPSQGAQTVVMESTYGDRLHPKEDPVALMGQVVQKILDKQSVLLIPSFAVGRAQSLLYLLYEGKRKGLIPQSLPIYVNSPMATQVSALYKSYKNWLNIDSKTLEGMLAQATFVHSMEESKKLNSGKGPLVIISASGMITGGRILHHIKEFGPNPDNVILLPGYQAQGTRGASLRDGARTLKIHGMAIPIHAQCLQWDHMSAHGDQKDLLRWLQNCQEKPQKVYIVHGEKESSQTLAQKIKANHSIPCAIPRDGETISL
jgi:metallo-beta-lactamase family protein